MNKEYRDYLDSEEWRELKLDLLMNRGCRCEECFDDKQPNELDVHHKTYERIFNELETDLILLCRRCHRLEHNLPILSFRKKETDPDDIAEVGRKLRENIYRSYEQYIKAYKEAYKREYPNKPWDYNY